LTKLSEGDCQLGNIQQEQNNQEGGTGKLRQSYQGSMI
jgi:hypothetical protein